MKVIVYSSLLLLVIIVSSWYLNMVFFSSDVEYSDDAFIGLETCNTKDLDVFAESIFKTSKPAHKLDSVWIYPYKGVVMWLPVEYIARGVCNVSGSINCGWASYLAVISPLTLADAKTNLLAHYGMDFSKIKTQETGTPSMPTIATSDQFTGTWLFCDHGDT